MKDFTFMRSVSKRLTLLMPRWQHGVAGESLGYEFCTGTQDDRIGTGIDTAKCCSFVLSGIRLDPIFFVMTALSFSPEAK